MRTTRRRMLGTGASVAAGLFFGRHASSFASVADVEDTIARFGDGETPRQGDLLALAIPEIAENGFSVPVSLSMASPMTMADHVASMMILAPENPELVIVAFHFTPASGVARVSTRMRLARTQKVIALARTSTGLLHRATRDVRVTIGGCGA